jgi:hypothetical protein
MEEQKPTLGRINIPDVDSYRVGIPVLRAHEMGDRIVHPSYDSSIMAGRVLRELPKGGLEVD